MAKRQFHLSKEEIEAIRQREHETDDPQELKRLQDVRAYGSQVPIHQITAVVGCSQDSMGWFTKKGQLPTIVTLLWLQLSAYGGRVPISGQ